ncbi:MAG: tRNA preQ1(34) S-adenosylmethionine ribosyltransferase-isomerase QueA [Phycisphaerae bacterium]
MKTEQLNYNLPEELIAQTPSEQRSASRLLVLERSSGSLSDESFADIVHYLRHGDCLVLNDTKVLAARFFACRQTGASLEGLFLSQADERGWHIMLRNGRKVKPGETFYLLDHNKERYLDAVACHRCGDGTWIIEPESDKPLEKILEHIGYAPLPPYIARPDGGSDPRRDRERYQTVFAKEAGAVAAPTAGLHFTDELLASIEAAGVRIARVTLHVGAGTFKPVTADNLTEHEIHSERYRVSHDSAALINATKANGGRVIAVGTTSVRTLETAGVSGRVEAQSGDTRLFIMPGYQYRIVDAMITNFHLPKSTLLALVGAFAGIETMMAAYRHAIERKYRFYSYGDAMFIY